MSVFSALEQRMRNMEARHRAELGWIKSERTKLQRLLAYQNSSIQSLELNLEHVVTNNSALYREQLQLHSTINNLLKMCPKNKGKQIGDRVIYAHDREKIHGESIRICSHKLLINSLIC